ncbi:FkbM family methyltransferase [Fulvivirga sp. 29W222]|uniref:FkbM family methyltransferase n=1 Tax=Fulvivirga marina TaxID=2494733 RepID=A0A937FUL4_9BACT|nr:FkbM family methyltransferase [Fulvivirga marina]MBL6444762.1 FkbM family methyltransferase [Fulvivirga marina]
MKKLIQGLLGLVGIRIARAGTRKYLPKPNIDNVQVVAHLYNNFKNKLTVLQVGACDGFTSDSIYPYIKAGTINAFLVEPVSINFQKLQEFYKDTPSAVLINAAVAGKDEKRIMYSVKDEGKWKDVGWARQLASFYKEHLTKHQFSDDEIAEQMVDCKTLKSIISEYKIEDLDILLIDTEGFDGEVVKMAMKQNVKPNYIIFENAQLVQNYSQEELNQLYNLLEDNGYSWTHDRINTMAVRKDYLRNIKMG